MTKTKRARPPAPHNAPQVLYCRPEQLRTHPHNLRRCYPEAQVREMAASIKAAGGVLVALRIVPNGSAGAYFVVDGNMRLAGARHLGPECPDLKCELVDDTEAEQLLAMAITAKVRYEPDPISEALHYQRLIEQGYKPSAIAAATGIGAATICARLRWLECAREIQDLVAEGRLPRDVRVAEALLAIPDATMRVKLAQRLARDGVGIHAIVRACARAVELLRHPPEDGGAKTAAPALELARRRTRGHPVPQVVAAEPMRLASFHVCGACEVKLTQFPRVMEPALECLTHTAGDTCGACNVRQVRDACNLCPLVDFLRRLLEGQAPAGGQ